jgi:hypothetical protein
VAESVFVLAEKRNVECSVLNENLIVILTARALRLKQETKPHHRASLSPREDAGRGRHGAKRSAGEGRKSKPDTREKGPLIRLRHLLPRKKRGGEGLSIY